MKFASTQLILRMGFVFLASSWVHFVAEAEEDESVAVTPENAAIDTRLLDKFGAPEPKDGDEANEKVERSGAPKEELIYLNASEVEITDMIKQISKATGTNFLIDDKLRGKITIISEQPMTKDMAYQAFLSALEVLGYTTVQSPAGVIKVIQTKDAITQPVDFYKDESPYTDKFITRIVQVQNISANELASVVKTLVSKQGNLFAYPATNSLIITDAGSNIDRILRIIKELDQEGPQEVIEIIPIKNADAGDITEKILQLYEDETSTDQGRGQRARRGRGQAELEEVPSISKVISDERTNSIIILGTKRSILKVRALVERLDSEVFGIEGTIHVYYLRHASAKEMAEVLSSLVAESSKGAPKAGQPKQGQKAGAVELESGVKVTADEGTNSLVITASPKDFQTLVDKVVSKLDIPRRQVYLEAVVMELSVDKTRTIGISGNFGNVFGLAGERVTSFGSVLPITPTAISSIAGAAGGLAGGGFSQRSIDFTLSDGSTISIPAVSAILQALQTDTDVNVLSTPSILTLDNEEAQIQVGEEVPTPSGTTVSSGVTTFNVTREDTGIILKITPQISESDTVRLKLNQEITNVVGSDPNLGPTLTKRAVQTVVVANNRQTIVIGGLIDDTSSVTTSKVPFLGDVPVVGNLFRTRTNAKTKTNIIVFITPYIIRERADYLDILKKKIEERNIFMDLNYGTGQRKAIRESIKHHATELLEFNTAVRDTTNYPPHVVYPPPQEANPPPASTPSSSAPASSSPSPSPGPTQPASGDESGFDHPSRRR